MMTTYSISEINAMYLDSFVEALGPIFEQSPWVAQRAWISRPFEDKDQLHDRMMAVVQQTSETEQLALFNVHPDLASRIQMSELSVKEQSGAGLTSLSAEEFEQFRACNELYVNKFGFPFIIAVKGKTKEQILDAMKTRINHSYEEEHKQALMEIARITRFRVEDRIVNDEQAI